MPAPNSTPGEPEPGEPMSPGDIDATAKRIALAQKWIRAKPKIPTEPEPEPVPTEKENEPPQSEPSEPVPAETIREDSEKVADENQLHQPNIAPIGFPSARPQPPNTKSEMGSMVIAKHLGPQLGSSPEWLGQGRWDERKLAVLQPETLAAISHFSYRYAFDKVRYWGHITDWWLVGSQGIGGLGRNHILKAIASSTGATSIERAKKPGILARNTTQRGWKEKAQAEGKEVEE